MIFFAVSVSSFLTSTSVILLTLMELKGTSPPDHSYDLFLLILAHTIYARSNNRFIR
jgi:hypothetical protein